ncbi:MAG: diguanylate cyclase domain-containing protein [Sulfuriferula sp.]
MCRNQTDDASITEITNDSEYLDSSREPQDCSGLAQERKLGKPVVIDDEAGHLSHKKSTSISAAETTVASMAAAALELGDSIAGRRVAIPADGDIAMLQQANAQLIIATLESQRLADKIRIMGEERYRTLFESIDEAFCIIEKIGDEELGSLDFLYIEANPAFEIHTGLSDVVGKTLRQVVPDEYEKWLATYHGVLKTGVAIKFEGTVVSLHRVLELHAFPIEDGTKRRVGVSFRDITQRKQAEAQLRSNHDTFFNLIENAPFGVYVVDAQFRMKQVSTASQKVFSHVRPLIGRDLGEIMHTIWPDPFASETIMHFRHTLETGEPYAAPNTTESRIDVSGVESYDWKIERIKLPDGQFGVVCYFYDITERQKAEDALRESEAFNRSIIKSSPDWISVLDLNGNLLSIQSGHIQLGIEDTCSFLNKSWVRLWDAPHRRSARAAVKAATEGGEGQFVGLFRTATGEPKWWDVSVLPILDENGKPMHLLSVSRDVTERKKAEEALRDSEQRYRNLFNSMDEGFCIFEMIFGEDGRPVDYLFLEVNPAFAKQTGVHDAPGRRMREIAPDIEAYWFDIYGKVVLTGEAVRFVKHAKSLDDSWFDHYAFRVGKEGNWKVAVVFNNITERKKAEQSLHASLNELRATESELRKTQTELSREKTVLAEHILQLQQVNDHLTAATIEAHTLAEEIENSRKRMAHLAQHDALTDLPNRTLLNDRLAQAILLSQRHGKQFALMFLDLDRFKHINDSLGHAIGDQLLQSVAKRLTSTVRGSDAVCRLGGDEFVILLADVEHAEDAARSAQKMLTILATPHKIERHELHIEASIGISVYPDDGRDAETLIKSADTAMYHAKENGRNNYMFFEQNITSVPTLNK